MGKKKILVASDHAGYELKNSIKKYIEELGYTCEDMGPHIYDKEDDYPDFVIPLAEKISQSKGKSKGIKIGGSGQGEAIAANKVKGIRAAVFYGPIKATKEIDVKGTKSNDPYEILKLTKIHNNANILSIGERFIDEKIVKKAVKLWLETEFTHEERNIRRVKKISDYEKNRD